MYLCFIFFLVSNKQSPYFCIILTVEWNLAVRDEYNLRTLLHWKTSASILVFMHHSKFSFNFLPELLHDVATTNKDFMGNIYFNVFTVVLKEESTDYTAAL